MDSTGSPPRLDLRSRSRRSIAHVSSSEIVSSKENLTAEVYGNPALASPLKTSIKKTRSRSIGPGGLDALRDDSGNRQKSAMAVQYKSILKPTIALSPPKAIPPRSGAPRVSPSKSKEKSSPGRSRITEAVGSAKTEDIFLLLPETKSARASADNTSPWNSASPSRGHMRVAVRTEEQQQAAVAERERQDMLARKDARRKSLANRRVSFAPEATLHTWDVVELPEDSTTSSASTNSTRRASSLTASTASPYPQPRSPMPLYDATGPPSTPPRQAEEVQVEASPAHQRDLHQKKRRRSSGIPPMNFNNLDDFSSSPCSPGSVTSDDAYQVSQVDEIDAASSDSDEKDLAEDETVTEVDREDATTRQSNNSSNTGSSGRLEEALRQAAEQAGTQGIDYDENGDTTMDMAEDEVTTAFKPWMKGGDSAPVSLGDPSAQQDQENINPFSPAFKAKTPRATEEDREETMDFTTAVGTILPQAPRGPETMEASLNTSGRLRRANLHRRGSDESLDRGDETMDLTLAVGGIDQNSNMASVGEVMPDPTASDEDEGLSMDFTAVVGGVLGQKTPLNQSGPTVEYDHVDRPQSRPSESDANGSLNQEDERASAVDKNLLITKESLVDAEDVTTGMDITTAIGAILPRELGIGDRALTRALTETETCNDDRKVMINQSPNAPLSDRVLLNASENSGSHEVLRQIPSGRRDRDSSRLSMTPEMLSRQPSSAKKTVTLSKQLTPKVVRPMTFRKTPPLKNIAMRTGSPRKLFKSEIKQATMSPVKGKAKTSSHGDPASNEVSKIDISMKPNSRRTSGIGIDRSGIGSPSVTEILDRRSSLKESSENFFLNVQPREGVRFADPRVLEQGLEQERLKDEQRESGRVVLQSEANDQQWIADENATASLKEKIQSLTPQKKRLKGRKSLHVGAAKGLLGKRPAELDDEEDENDTTPKHLRAMEGSPVKKVRLPAPPQKNTTSGRTTRSTRAGPVETSGNSRPSTPSTTGSPLKAGFSGTPKDQPRFKDARLAASPVKARLDRMEASVTQEPVDAKLPEIEDRIHLQDFLNLTSIRFMELTTTKRRHTVAPNALSEHSVTYTDKNSDGSLQDNIGYGVEDCVVAGACTLPMLDLYQHSCHELKKYIAEGRNIVREIEAETFKDNPSLFREYIGAPAELKSVMDNQFKNVKTHARLLSKAMWYEWRMKLLDSLKEGLATNAEGMDRDYERLIQQERLFRTALPDLTIEHDRLESDVRALQDQADELASCDQEELKEARSNLNTVDDAVSEKRRLKDDLQNQMRNTEINLAYYVKRKHECAAEIQEAEKIRQESRGWDFSEIIILQGKYLWYHRVNVLEHDHGWIITSAAEESVTMTYKRTLQLYFTPRAFKPVNLHSTTAGLQNASISLTYVADHHQYHPQPLSTEKRFFLQSMQAQLQFLQQPEVTAKDLLTFISSSWDTACEIAEEARLIGLRYMTEPIILSDETLLIQSTILLRAMKTKVGISFEVSICSGEGVANMDVTVKPNARFVYGEELNGKKMGDFLGQKLDVSKKEKNREKGRWAQVAGELEKRLIPRGKKS